MTVTDFSDAQTLSLREQALNRVREMQQKAQRSLEQSNNKASMSPVFSDQNNAPEYHDIPNAPSAQPVSQRNFASNNIFSQLFGAAPPNMRGNIRRSQAAPQNISDLIRRRGLGDSIENLGETVQSTVASVSRPLADLMESFGIDGEKLVILLVMWAVFNEHKENKTLLMALGYLLL